MWLYAMPSRMSSEITTPTAWPRAAMRQLALEREVAELASVRMRLGHQVSRVGSVSEDCMASWHSADVTGRSPAPWVTAQMPCPSVVLIRRRPAVTVRDVARRRGRAPREGRWRKSPVVAMSTWRSIAP